MSKIDLAHIGQAVQQVHAISPEHTASFIEGTRRKLAVVRVKRKQPQTRADHAVLAEREARYCGYLKLAGVKA